jgi:hypothetical protein
MYLILIILTRKISKAHIILAQNFSAKMPFVFLILIYIFLACKIVKTLISAAQNFRKNDVKFR